MAMVDMDLDAARSWIRGIEALNEELTYIMNGTHDSIQVVQQSSQGSVVDLLIDALDDMIMVNEGMRTGFEGLVEAVINFINRAEMYAEEIEATAREVARSLMV